MFVCAVQPYWAVCLKSVLLILHLFCRIHRKKNYKISFNQALQKANAVSRDFSRSPIRKFNSLSHFVRQTESHTGVRLLKGKREAWACHPEGQISSGEEEKACGRVWEITVTSNKIRQMKNNVKRGSHAERSVGSIVLDSPWQKSCRLSKL